MPRRVYTKEILEPIVEKSISMAQVLRELDLRQSGGMHAFIKKRIIEYGLDISHWLGSRANSGKNHKCGQEKLTPEKVFVENRLCNGRKESIRILRRAMFEFGIAEICNGLNGRCGQGPSWNGEKLQLQVDHINGNCVDNRIENIRFLCPNCHSQTANFAGKKNKKHKEIKRKEAKKVKNKCSCGKDIYQGSMRCKSCTKLLQKTKIVWPSQEELMKMLSGSNFSQVAKQLGVSDNAVRKRLKRYGPVA